MSAVQKHLDFKTRLRTGPCCARREAAIWLNVDDWKLAELLDQGALGWVIDVRSPGAGTGEFRFVLAELDEFSANGFVREKTAAQIAATLFGLEAKFVSAKRIYKRMAFEDTHFYDLAREGAIRCHTTQRKGAGGSAMVAWGEMVKFLESRKV